MLHTGPLCKYESFVGPLQKQTNDKISTEEKMHSTVTVYCGRGKTSRRGSDLMYFDDSSE